MTDYRKILMLRSKGCSQREMERSKVASREKTKEVYEAADKLGLSWPLDDDITSAELEEILFPGKYKSGVRYVEPDYPYIHRELAKPGVTMALLWEEYCRKCHEAGKTPYLFVAVLPCSCYTYAEACEDMKTENWLACHIHAFHYFGGVTRLLIPDNCKTATTANTRYETVLNRSYQELAEYYGTAVVPARVRKPQDKSAAEASVRFAETWILAALRERKFFSVREVNEAVAEKLEHMPLAHQKYLAYNTDDFSRWAMSVGPMTEKVVQYFLTSGTAPEQGYKACASLTKLGERYGRERLENACGRILAYSAAPSIRNISSLLKNGQDRPAKATPPDKPNDSNRFGITRGASYFKKGGDR